MSTSEELSFTPLRTELLFRHLMVDACHRRKIHLSLVAQNHLAHLLAEYATKPELLSFRVADHLLESERDWRTVQGRGYYLQGANVCLLLTGLFPEICQRRHVSPGYYYGWAYRFLTLAEPYEERRERYPAMQLAHELGPMVRTLRTIRRMRTEPKLIAA